MNKIEPIILICIIISIFTIRTTLVNAECCRQTIWVLHECSKIPHQKHSFDHPMKDELGVRHLCRSNICYDGTPVDGFYCGLGECTFFGCFCEEGCRTNSKNTTEEAIRIFGLRYNLKRLVEDPNRV